MATQRPMPLVPAELLQRMHELNARQLIAAAEHELRRAQSLERAKPKAVPTVRRRGQYQF